MSNIINLKTNTTPFKYTILIPKDITKIKNTINLAEGKITLSDFYVYSLVYESDKIKLNDNKTQNLLKLFDIDSSVIPNMVTIKSVDRTTPNYRKYSNTVKYSMTTELISRVENYKNKVGAYNLYYVENIHQDTISRNAIFVVGLNQILNTIQQVNTRAYKRIKNDINPHDTLIGTLGLQEAVLNEMYSTKDFLFEYDYFKGKYIHPMFIKNRLSFLEECFYTDTTKLNKEYFTFKRDLKYLNNKTTYSFTKEIVKTFTFVNNSRLAFIKSLNSNFVMQDTHNFFGNEFYTEKTMKINDKEWANNVAKKVQDYVNLFGCSEKVRNYNNLVNDYNSCLDKLHSSENSYVGKMLLYWNKIYTGKPKEVFKKLTFNELNTMICNPTTELKGLELDIPNKSLVYNGKDYEYILSQINLYKNQLQSSLKEDFNNLQLSLDKYNKSKGEYGFIRCSYSASRTNYKMILSCYIPRGIKIEKNTQYISLEADAFCGGIIDNYVQGKIETPLTALDINSMYPWIMSKYPMPTGIKEASINMFNLSIDDILEKAKDTQCCIVSGILTIPNDIGISPVPMKVELNKDKYELDTVEIMNNIEESIWDTINIFPVGKFKTTLCYHTLKLLKELQLEGYDIKFSSSSYVIYNSDIYLKDYSEYLYELRNDILELPVANDIKSVVKLAQVTIFGQFASHRFSDSGNRTHLFNNRAFPAISAHITDAARAHMYRLMKKAGFENVYSVSTDGLKVNWEGRNNLENEIDYINKPMGKLKVESFGQFSFSGKAGYIGYWLNTENTLERGRSGGEFEDVKDKDVTEYFKWYLNSLNRNLIRNIYSSYYYQEFNPNKNNYINITVNSSIQDFLKYNKYINSLTSTNIDIKKISHGTHSNTLVEELIDIRNKCHSKVDGISNDNSKYKNLDIQEEEIDIEI